MKLKQSKEEILTTLAETTKLGDIKKMAKVIKKDHDFAMELWSSTDFHQRMLAVLIMDKTRLDSESLDNLVDGLSDQSPEERDQIADWLLANQLMKSKKTIELLESWEKAGKPLMRRLFWYHQARLRWTGQTPPDNTEHLLNSLESDMGKAEPEVQQTMNFTAGWIGIHQPEYRARCMELGEKLGLYKGEPVSRGCTPSYLPEFIRIEVAKREEGKPR